MAVKYVFVKMAPKGHALLLSVKKELHKRNPELKRVITNPVVMAAALKAFKKSGLKFSLGD